MVDITKISNLTLEELIPLMEEQFNVPNCVIRKLEVLIEEKEQLITNEYQEAIDDLTLKVNMLEQQI